MSYSVNGPLPFMDSHFLAHVNNTAVNMMIPILQDLSVSTLVFILRRGTVELNGNSLCNFCRNYNTTLHNSFTI